MYFVYVLYSSAKKGYYVGLTTDLTRRLKEHNSRKSTSTQNGIPWVVVHKEVFETRTEARHREKYLKSAAGRRWRKQHIRPPSSTE